MEQKPYSIRKSKKILRLAYSWYKKTWDKDVITPAQTAEFETNMAACDEACLKGDVATADQYARKLEEFTALYFKKSWSQYLTELFIALAVALAIATIIRSSWFELYEIPTGSMRPTFKEQDHLTVSKTQFGINMPLKTNHFYFDPNLVERGGIVIWSGDGVALQDVDTTYFGVFPYKKRYIKRMIGKPGDILYFYGGKIYGIDKEGKLIEELLNSPSLEKLEHIPFLTFEGEIVSPKRGVIQFEQMHQPIGRLILNPKGEWTGEVYDSNSWIKDQPAFQSQPHEHIKTYSDFMGIRNFAEARLLTKKELQQYPDLDTSDLENGVLYLELIHHPSLAYPKPYLRTEQASLSIALNPLRSVIPLQQKHLDALMENMYTARFEVVSGRAKRYNVNSNPITSTSPAFPGIPDGTYEFYYGTGDKVGWGGITSQLPPDHPLYSRDPANVQRLFNYGMDLSMFVEPKPTNKTVFPRRYAYFRDGDFYLLGAPVIKKDDPTLANFLKREEKREQQSTEARPYAAFKDYGPPLKDGQVDQKFIRAFGIEISPKDYMVLGDNHAMSADSRVFGFLPEDNLQGVPDLIIWPPGSRLGHPSQVPYPLFTVPRLIVWSIVAAIGLIWYLIDRYRLKQPVFKKLGL